MRIAVTGADGFVGQWLARELGSAGHEVVTGGASRPDVTDARAVQAWLADTKPAAVVHLAAVSSGAAAAGDPDRAFAVTVGGTINLLEAVRELDPPPIVLIPSSGEVYGRPAAEELPLSETAALRPGGAYALSKAAQESVALAIGGRSDVRVIVARAFNHTGPGQRPAFVVPALAARIAAVAAGRASEVHVGNLDVARDFLDVRDVVRAYRLLLERAGDGAIASGTVVNVCSGRSITIRRIVDVLCRHAGVDVPLVVDPALVRPGEASEVRGDPGRLTSLVGWRPEIPIEQTLADVLAAAAG
jgi:GDP-4-dehydro-6-deoxy-D-mannose reductase